MEFGGCFLSPAHMGCYFFLYPPMTMMMMIDDD